METILYWLHLWVRFVNWFDLPMVTLAVFGLMVLADRWIERRTNTHNTPAQPTQAKKKRPFMRFFPSRTKQRY